MRKNGRRVRRYGSLDLLEALLAIAIPELALAQSPTCSISASPASPITAGQASFFTATCTSGPTGGAPTSVSWSVSPSLGTCSTPILSSFTSRMGCTFSTAGTATVSARPIYGCFNGTAGTYQMQVNGTVPTCTATSPIPFFPVTAGLNSAPLVSTCVSDTTILGYEWKVQVPSPFSSDDPGFSCSTSSCSYSPTIPGVFVASVRARNAIGYSAWASTNFSAAVNPSVAPPTCTYTANPPGGAVPITVTLSANCSPQVTWWATIGPITGPATLPCCGGPYNITVPGTYVFSYRNPTNAGGTGPDVQTTFIATNAPVITPPGGCTLQAPSTGTANTPVSLLAACSTGSAATQYSWRLVQQPAGANASLPATTATGNNSFTPAVAGTYVVGVTASNAGGSATEVQRTITVTAATVAPGSCTLSAPTSATIGQPASLLAACDTGSAVTQYSWRLVQQPAGSNASLPTPTTSGSNAFTPAVAGAYVVGVTASNSAGSAAEVQRTITVPAAPALPVCTITPSTTSPRVGQTLTLTGSCTNNPLNFSWTGCSSTTAVCTDAASATGTKTYTLFASNAVGNGTPASITVTWGSTSPPPPPPPTGGGAVVGAATGSPSSGLSALIRDDGTLWSWGLNARATLGDGSTTSRSVPGQVNGLTNIVASASAQHTLALDSAGHVFAWGPNANGELGLGSRVAQSQPTLVPSLSGIRAIAAGDNFSLALQSDGSVWAWGRNHVGQLGDGTQTDQLAPVRVPGLANVVSIAASASHAAAVRSDGSVFVWGNELFVPVNQSARPVQVPIANVKEVQTGGLNTFVLKNDGTVWGWGRPDGGRLGDGGTGDGRTPVQVRGLPNVVSVVAGGSVSMALASNGVLWGWGENRKGQLGLGHANAVSVPVTLTVPIAAGSIKSAAAGDSSYVADAQGRLYGAGGNETGALGLGDTLETRAPKLVAGIDAVSAVAAGASESLALRNGTVWSWGGVDPNNPASSTATPRAVAGLAGTFVAIAAGPQAAAAVRSDGVVYGWGTAVPGVGGITTPAPIPGLANIAKVAVGGAGIIGLTTTGRALIACAGACPGSDFGFADVTAVAAGARHFLVRRGDGSVWAWGANDRGQHGAGNTATSATPVRVPLSGAASSIAAGADYSVAMLTDGTAFAWGLTPPFATPRLSPTRVAELDGATQLAASSHLLALDAAFRGRAWGGTSKAGERDHVVPGREPRMDGLRQVAAGARHSLGVTAAGEVVAWGQNTSQQLGVLRKLAVAEWLPVNDPTNPTLNSNSLPVVEYLNASIESGHHFITIDKAEVDNLDNGGLPPWQRTGRSWRAWASRESAPANAKPVYRFFSSRFNSHFYTVEEAEKNALVAANPSRDLNVSWVLESTAFYALPAPANCPSLSVSPRSPYVCAGGQQPAATDCPAGYYPVYRAFNSTDSPNPKRTLPNHRFTSNWIDIYRSVRFSGYQFEGVAFCSPAAAQRGGDLQAFNTVPARTVNTGEFLQFDYWYGNAGPGEANGATIVAVIPAAIENTLVLCQAFNGAQCPAQPKWTADALRQGVAVPALPAGGVLRFTVNGRAPAQPQELNFTSSIGAPSEAPDPFGFNNAAPVSTTVVTAPNACTPTVLPGSLALPRDGAAGVVTVSLPAGCPWQASGDQPWLSIVDGSGGGSANDGSNRRFSVGVGGNGGGERTGTVKIASRDGSAQLGVQQAGTPAVPVCSKVTLRRKGDQNGSAAKDRHFVAVDAPNDCSWDVRVDPAAPWIAVSATTGRGSGQVEYSLQANADGVERVGRLTIGNETFTIVQSSVGLEVPAGASGSGDGGGDGSGGDGSGSGGDAPG